MNVAYIRCSTNHQQSTEGRQAVENFPVQIDKTFVDAGFSGGNAERPGLKAMLDYIRSGDAVYCYDISRLARSVKDFATLTEAITSKGASLHFVKENLHVGGENDPTQKLFVQILSAMAEWELSIMKERRAEGIAKARQRNAYKNVGRKMTLSPEQIDHINQRIAAGEAVSNLAKDFHVPRTTLYKYCNVNQGGKR